MLDKWLTVVGLIFEFSSVYSLIKEIFLTKQEYIEDKGKSIDVKNKETRKKSLKTVGLLAIGMSLQGIALFV